jgi:nucleoside-diphosphate-sugar epimerase
VAVGEPVRVLDNFSAGKMENLQGVEDHVDIVNGDILDEAIVARSMQEVGVVLHQGALRSVPFSVENPDIVNRVSV